MPVDDRLRDGYLLTLWSGTATGQLVGPGGYEPASGRLPRMEAIVIRSDDPDPEAVAVFRAAVRVYANWCREHNLAVVTATTMRIDPGKRSYMLYAADGPLISGAIDALLPALDR